MATIGLFDSGMGGLTVAREVMRQVPSASIEYYGDNGRSPYGPRHREEIIGFSKQIADFLACKNIDLLIIACNTATAAALDSLFGKYDFPVIGVIGPGAQAASVVSKNKRIGVLATQFTTDSKVYVREIQKHDQDAVVIGQACPMFVTLVEAGHTDGPEVDKYAKEYVSVFAGTGIDTLVLGCTHYPVLIDHIKRHISPDVSIVDPAFETVREAKSLLAGKLSDLQDTPPQYRFYTSGDPSLFEQVGSRIFGAPLGNVEKMLA